MKSFILSETENIAKDVMACKEGKKRLVNRGEQKRLSASNYMAEKSWHLSEDSLRALAEKKAEPTHPTTASDVFIENEEVFIN